MFSQVSLTFVPEETSAYKSRHTISGSAQQSVKVCILRGLLESDVFAREACPMATSHQNGQNPQVRYGNDAPGQPCRDPNWTSPGAWKPASNAGSHIPTATAPAGYMAATRPNPAEIGVSYRFLHRTRKIKIHLLEVAKAPLELLAGSAVG